MDNSEETHYKERHIENQQQWQQHFFQCTINGRAAQLFIKKEKLQISVKEKIQVSVSRSDLIGFECIQEAFQSYSINLHSFPRLKRMFKKQKRYIQHTTIKIQASCDMIESIKVILLKYITNRKINSSKELPKILIVYNPKAGANSKSHFEKVLAFLKFTNFQFDVLQTTHKNHLRQFLDIQNTSQYQSIVIVSGDGLIHQFANSKIADKIPISHVPAGTGNGFAKSQSDIAGQDCDDENAIYLVVKGRIKQMNLVAIQLENEPNIIYSFLSLQWAFLADIDMNSQFLRMLGKIRFEIYSVFRVLALKKYTAKLTYSQQTTDLPPLNEPINNISFKQIDANFLNALFCSVKFISDKYQFAPLLKSQQKVIDMQIVTEQQGRWQLVKYLLASESGSHFDRQQGVKKKNFNFIHAKIKSFRLQPSQNAQNKGLFGIDGERYQAQRMQASISDKRMKTFV